MVATLTASQLADYTTDVPWLILDFETAGKDKQAALHPMAAQPIGFSILTPKGWGYVALHKPEWETGVNLVDQRVAGEILRGVLPSTPLINWNCKFDRHLLSRLTGVEPTVAIDPQVGLWLLSETSPLNLKGALGDLTSAHFPDFRELLKQAADRASEIVKETREVWAKGQKAASLATLGQARKEAIQRFPTTKTTNWDIPVSTLAPYCNRDVAAVGLLWFGYIRPALEAEGLLDYFYRYEMPFSDVLYSMEHTGITLDLDACGQLALSTLSEVIDISSQVYDLAGEEFNIGSLPELGRIVFDKLGFKPTRLTETGNPSLDEKALKDLLWEHQDKTRLFDLLLDWRTKTKLHGTYAKALPEWALDGIVYTRFNHTGTATGRLSSDSPNLQNQPKKKEVKRIWRARPGKVLVAADLSQGELRVLAHRTQDPVLLEVYRNGEDLHARTMAAFGIENRTIAKNANFGLVYGVAEKTFREGLLYDAGVRISSKEAKGYLASQYELYAGIGPWKERVWAEAARKGYVETFLGRRRHLPELAPDAGVSWGERSYAERQAVNSLIQGDVADLERIAMIRVRPVFRQFGGELLLQVHDEVVGEVDESMVRAACPEIKRTIEGIRPDLSVPLVSDCEYGPNWGRMQEYKAE